MEAIGRVLVDREKEDELVVRMDTGAAYSVIRKDFYVKLEGRGLIGGCLPVTN